MEEPLRRLFGRENVTYFSAIAAGSCQLIFRAGLVPIRFRLLWGAAPPFFFHVSVGPNSERYGILLMSCTNQFFSRGELQSSLAPFVSAFTSNCLNMSRSTCLKALSSVEAKTTFGTALFPILPSWKAWKASNHLEVHRHHLHPPVRPATRRSFPCDAVKSKNSSETTPATAWLPKSAAPVLQNPSR